MAKMIRRLGGLTSLRSGTSTGTPNSGSAGMPTSPEFAKNFMNFRFNHLNQRNTMPNVLGRGSDSGVDWRTCNSAYGGRACTFGVGGAPGQDQPAGPVNDAGPVRVNNG